MASYRGGRGGLLLLGFLSCVAGTMTGSLATTSRITGNDLERRAFWARAWQDRRGTPKPDPYFSMVIKV